MNLNETATKKQIESFDKLIRNNYEIKSIQYLMRGKIRIYLMDNTMISIFKNGKMYHDYIPEMPAITKELNLS